MIMLERRDSNCPVRWRQHAAAQRLEWLANEHVLASFLRCRLFDIVYDRMIGCGRLCFGGRHA